MQICSELPTIIVDIGTEYTKIGYATHESPLIYTPTKTIANNFKTPLLRGDIQDYTSYCTHLIDSLKLFDCNLYSKNQPQDYYSLIICQNTSDDDNKHNERILSHVFSNIDGYRSPFNAVLFANNQICDLFSYGKTNGVVVSLSSKISVTGIVDGLIFTTTNCKFGSADINEQIYNLYKDDIDDLLEDTNEKIEKICFKRLEIAREIKESVMSFITNPNPQRYELPRKLTLNINPDDVKNITEMILKNIIDLIKEVIEKCDVDRKNNLMNNIVLTGGMSNIPGLYDKLTEELSKIYPPSKLKLTFEKNIFNTFLGASVIGSLGSMKAFFISRADYDQFGTNIFTKKRFKWNLK